MSFSSPATPPVYNPNDQQRFSSWRESVPCPMATGCVKTGLLWMTDQFGLQNPKAGQYENYFVSSIVGLIGVSPLHRLGFVWISGQPTFALNMNWNAQGYADTPVPAWLNGIPGFNSKIRVYQGLETQTPDADLIAATGQQHPSYKGSAYAIIWNANWGIGASGVANVEIEWISIPPAIDGWQTGDDNLYGVNPIAGLYTILTHRRGGAGMTGYLDPVAWATQGQALEAGGGYGLTGQQTYCHLCYTSAKDVQSLLAEAAVYFDGFYTISGSMLGVSWRPGQSLSATGLTELSDINHVEPPDITTTGRDEMPSIVVLTYTEGPGAVEPGTYATRAAIGQVSRNIAAAPGNQTTKKYDFPFLKGPDDGTRLSVPQMIVARLSQEAGVLDSNGTSRVFRRDAVWASGVPLTSGDLFVLNYSLYNLNRIVRIRSIQDDCQEEYVEITWQRERGAFPTTYQAPSDPRIVPFDNVPGAIATTDICPFFLPAGFGSTRQVCVLIQRPTFSYANATIWFSQTSGGTYGQLGTQNAWAVHATLTTAAGSSDASIAITTAGIDMPAIQSQATLAQNNDTLLAIIPSTGEVLSVGTVSVTSSAHYSLGVLRGRQGSAAAAASNGADVWLIARSSITAYANAEWINIFSGGVYNSTTATKYFQVQPASMTRQGTAAPSGGIAFTLPTSVPSAPSGLTAIVPGGPVVSLSWTATASQAAPLFDEFIVQRSASSSSGPWTTIGSVDANHFDDTGTVGGISVGTQYWYQVLAADIYGNLSAGSNVVTATPTGVAANTLPPQAAGNVTFHANGQVVTAGDGTVTVGMIFNVPGLTPAATGYLAAATQNLLWRPTGSTNGWTVGMAEMTNTGSVFQSIDRLPPNIQIDVALQEFTAFKQGGAITVASGGPFTTPAKGQPTQPGGVGVRAPSSGDTIHLYYNNSTVPPTLFWAAVAYWTPVTDLDVIGYEVVDSYSIGGAPSNSDPVGRYGPMVPSGRSASSAPSIWSIPTSSHMYVRSVNSSLIASNWVDCGSVAAYISNTYAGNMGGQNNTSIQVTGGKVTGLQTGDPSQSSVVTKSAEFFESFVYNTTSGGAYETITRSISNRGFTSAPTAAFFTTNQPNVKVTYNPYYSGQSPTTVYLDVNETSNPQQNIPAGTQLIINGHYIQ